MPSAPGPGDLFSSPTALMYCTPVLPGPWPYVVPGDAHLRREPAGPDKFFVSADLAVLCVVRTSRG